MKNLFRFTSYLSKIQFLKSRIIFFTLFSFFLILFSGCETYDQGSQSCHNNNSHINGCSSVCTNYQNQNSNCNQSNKSDDTLFGAILGLIGAGIEVASYIDDVNHHRPTNHSKPMNCQCHCHHR